MSGNRDEVQNDEDEYDKTFFVPERSRWSTLKDLKHDIGSELNKATEAIEEHNASLEGVLVTIDFNIKNKLSDKKLQDLLSHFSRHRLRNSDFESPDLLGSAYEYLIKQFADSAGKKGGEFYTPSEVVWLLVSLLKPTTGMRIYDPTAGSGGMLIQTRNYLIDQGENPQNLSLYGQEMNLNTWAISKMNMFLHGVFNADLRKGDTMGDPRGFVKVSVGHHLVDVGLGNPLLAIINARGNPLPLGIDHMHNLSRITDQDIWLRLEHCAFIVDRCQAKQPAALKSDPILCACQCTCDQPTDVLFEKHIHLEQECRPSARTGARRLVAIAEKQLCHPEKLSPCAVGPINDDLVPLQRGNRNFGNIGIDEGQFS
jgi:hypothetical protein